MITTVEPLVSRFQYRDFQQKDVVQLMKSIWVFSDVHSRRCRACQRYRIWAIEALREKWLSCYIDFDRVVFKLTSRDKNYAFIPYIPPGFSLFLYQPHIRDEIMGKSTKTTTTTTATTEEEPTSTARLRQYLQQSESTTNKKSMTALLINWSVTTTATTTTTTTK